MKCAKRSAAVAVPDDLLIAGAGLEGNYVKQGSTAHALSGLLNPFQKHKIRKCVYSPNRVNVYSLLGS